MNRVNITAEYRENIGKAGSKQLRYEGKVPAVLYGTENPIHLSVLASDLNPIICTRELFFIELKIGEKTYQTINQDLQIHPLNEKIVHADFLLVKENKPLIVEAPITLLGTSSGVLMGGILSLKYKKMRILGLPNNLPSVIEIDIDGLEIGQSIRIKDIKVKNYEFLHPQEDNIVSVRTSRVSQEEDSEIEVEEVATEETTE